jgi:hypothetical protein
MNTTTTILIPFQQYYFFTSDCGSFPANDAATIASLLGKVLILMAKRHPSILQDLSFFEKQRLRANQKNCVPMVLGKETITALETLTKCSESKVSLLARALLKEYAAMDVKTRAEILAKI